MTTAEMKATLLGLNRDSAPWQVRDGAGDGTDLVVEWRILAPRWYEIFGKAGLERVTRIYLLCDDATRTVRALDEELEAAWSEGVPRLSIVAPGAAPHGPRHQWPPGVAIGFTEQVRPGVIQDYKFATDELKRPIVEAVEACGWRFEPVRTRGAVARTHVAPPPGALAPPGSAAPARYPNGRDPYGANPNDANAYAANPYGANSNAANPYAVNAPAANPYDAPPAGLVVAPQAAMQPPSNPLSVAGFVCGLLGLTPFWIGFVLCILAIVFSATAMSKSSRTGAPGRGLAIAGLVLGLVFILPAMFGL